MVERTTPAWARLPVLAGLAVLAAYFVACWSFALGAERPAWAERVGEVWWVGNWQMFTVTDVDARLFVAEAEVDGAWQPVDIQALFPARWESGHRFNRAAWLGRPSVLRVVGQATCRRHPERPTRVRFYGLRWKKKLGRSPLPPPRNARSTEPFEWDCARTVALPKGRRF